MKKSDFCINTERYGSVWGTIVEWEFANKIAVDIFDKNYTDLDNCIRYEGNLMDYNTKVYVWLKVWRKNDFHGDNFFIEIK